MTKKYHQQNKITLYSDMLQKKQKNKTADELSGMLKKNNFKGVLTYIGKNPPNCKDGDVHKQIAESVLDALRSIKKRSRCYIGRNRRT